MLGILKGEKEAAGEAINMKGVLYNIKASMKKKSLDLIRSENQQVAGFYGWKGPQATGRATSPGTRCPKLLPAQP